ncbi:MAG TPA: tetratricopeptide repeat protein [Opitutaceae bacterium]|jgi:tetratricopeptide (TPR) repeat protein
MLASSRALKANRLDAAIARCDQALALSHGFEKPDARYSRSQVLRAEIYMWQKRDDLAEKCFHGAVASCEAEAGPDSAEMIYPLSSLGNYYYYYEVHLDRVAALNERILGIIAREKSPNEHDVIIWSRNLAIVYQQMGRFDLAEPLYAAAVTHAEKAVPDWLPHELLTEAAFYRAWGKFSQAEPLASRALAIRERSLAIVPSVDTKLDTSVALDELGAIYLASGRPEKAEDAYRRSLEIDESFMTEDQADLLPRITGLASALLVRHKYPEAESLLAKAVAITRQNFPVDSPEVKQAEATAAALKEEMGKGKGSTPAASEHVALASRS